MTKTNKRMTVKTAVDGGTAVPEIMARLLEEPGVKEQAARMTAAELEWFQELLVSQGIYAGYVEEHLTPGPSPQAARGERGDES